MLRLTWKAPSELAVSCGPFWLVQPYPYPQTVEHVSIGSAYALTRRPCSNKRSAHRGAGYLGGDQKVMPIPGRHL